MKLKLTIALSMLLAACSPEPTAVMPVTQESSRFTITRIAVIEDDLAYGNRRGVYVLKDNKTGVEYIGLSGIGVSELGSHQVGKIPFSDER